MAESRQGSPYYAELIKAFCPVCRPEEVGERVRALQRQGVRQIKCNFPPDSARQMLRDFSPTVIAKM